MYCKYPDKMNMIKLYHFALAILLIASLNTGLKLFKIDLINMIPNDNVKQFIYIIVCICVFFLFKLRDFWLPFLGDAVLPEQLVPLKKNKKHDTTIEVKVPKGSKVAYWAAKKTKKDGCVMKAYDDYSNSGVVMEKNGIVKLKVIKGSGYFVPSGKYIKPHVHYRILNKTNGMMGPIRTVYYN